MVKANQNTICSELLYEDMMARKKIIPDEIREEVIASVDAFNKNNTTTKPAQPSGITQLMRMLGMAPAAQPGKPIGSYVPRFRGAFLYLDRIGWDGRPSEICRLKWTGKMENWEFAIYLHSRNAYDPDEWMFPGSGYVDGTVEGAMRAGMEAYPE
jgi:hypothetical protein